VPGLTPDVDPLAAFVALAATLAWSAFAVWRARVRPPMLWRGPALAAAGLTAMWVVVATLYGNAIEYNRGMRTASAILGAQVKRLVGAAACVQGYQLPAGTRAMLAYHGDIRFSRHTDNSDACPIVIHRDSQRTQFDDAPPIGDWDLAYELTRRARYDETFRIWVRRH